jgi:hypothetical protein
MVAVEILQEWNQAKLTRGIVVAAETPTGMPEIETTINLTTGMAVAGVEMMISGVGMVLPQEMRREADLLLRLIIAKAVTTTDGDAILFRRERPREVDRRLLSMIAIQNVPTLRDQERMNIIITHRRVKLGAQNHRLPEE